MMTWFLIGIFVSDQTFYFRILETHNNQIECIYASEMFIQQMDKPLLEYNVVCVGTEQIPTL